MYWTLIRYETRQLYKITMWYTIEIGMQVRSVFLQNNKHVHKSNYIIFTTLLGIVTLFINIKIKIHKQIKSQTWSYFLPY